MHPVQRARRTVGSPSAVGRLRSFVLLGARLRTAVWLGTVIVVDQAFKALVASVIPLGTSIVVLPHILALTHVRNQGIAFGLQTSISPLIPAAVALTGIFFLFYNKVRWSLSSTGRLALVLASGGALGNLIDRLRFGAVIDYVDLYVWPVFNVADAAITIGVALLLIAVIRRGE